MLFAFPAAAVRKKNRSVSDDLLTLKHKIHFTLTILLLCLAPGAIFSLQCMHELIPGMLNIALGAKRSYRIVNVKSIFMFQCSILLLEAKDLD